MTTPAAVSRLSTARVHLNIARRSRRLVSVRTPGRCTPGRRGATALSASARLSIALSCSTLSTRAATAARCGVRDAARRQRRLSAKDSLSWSCSRAGRLAR
eukprot:4418463-Prymnesium_polylepis.1